MTLGVIIPAFNEAAYLPATLAALQTAAANLPCEIIVVDNDSTDGTGDVAIRYGAAVIRERVRNISRVRNTGAGAATGDVLVFLDADTRVPPSLLRDIGDAMRRERSVGGAVAVDYTTPRRAWVRWYLKGWAFWSRFFNMKLGAAQFCRTEAFRRLGGYDDRIYVGEDIEFYWASRRMPAAWGASCTFSGSRGS